MSLLGDYELINDVVIGDAVSTGTIKAGSKISVEQEWGGDVLVRFGDGGSVSWFSKYWLSVNTGCIAL